MHKETNYRTEFVVALKDQPQGGLITRKPTTETRIASRDETPSFWGGWGGWGSQQNQTNTQRRAAPAADPRQNSQNYSYRPQR